MSSIEERLQVLERRAKSLPDLDYPHSINFRRKRRASADGGMILCAVITILWLSTLALLYLKPPGHRRDRYFLLQYKALEVKDQDELTEAIVNLEIENTADSKRRAERGKAERAKCQRIIDALNVELFRYPDGD